MDGTVVKVDAVNHGQSTLSRSFNDLNGGQELHALNVSSLTPFSGNANEKCASLPDIALPKISSAKRKEETLFCDQTKSDLQRRSKNLLPIHNDPRQSKTSLNRPKSCTARVHLTSVTPGTPEFFRRNRMPRPSLPVAVETSKIRSAPTSPTMSKRLPDSAERPTVSKTASFTSSKSVVEETDLAVGFRRKSYDVGSVSSSTPPVSPALRRKFEDSEKTARKAKNLIDDYKRSSPVQQRRDQMESKSLAEALEEVKNCRYLRVVNRK